MSGVACLERQRLEGRERNCPQSSGGVMAELNTYTAMLGPFDEAVPSIAFVFKCRCAPDCRCAPEDLCCDERHYTVLIKRLVKKGSSESALTTLMAASS